MSAGAVLRWALFGSCCLALGLGAGRAGAQERWLPTLETSEQVQVRLTDSEAMLDPQLQVFVLRSCFALANRSPNPVKASVAVDFREQQSPGAPGFELLQAQAVQIPGGAAADCTLASSFQGVLASQGPLPPQGMTHRCCFDVRAQGQGTKEEELPADQDIVHLELAGDVSQAIADVRIRLGPELGGSICLPDVGDVLLTMLPTIAVYLRARRRRRS